MNGRGKRMRLGLLAALLFWGVAAAAGAETITVRADEWCPYNCEPGAAKPGYMVEVLNLIFGRAGHTVDYQTLNWARSIEETREGKYDAIIGAVVGDAEDFVFPQSPFGMSANGFCVRAGEKWSYAGAESFAGRVLAVVRDYSYEDEEIDGYIEAHKADPARVQVASGDNALELNLRKLAKGRVDVVVDDFAVLRRSIKDLDLTGQLSCKSDEGADPVYIAFSPKSPNSKKYAQIFDQGIGELRRDGTLAKILAGYGLDDWK